MPAKAFKVEARAEDLSNLGAINDYAALTVQPRFNNVGSWSLTYPVGSKAASLLGAGRGVRIIRRGNDTPVLTGPVLGITETIDPSRKIPVLTFTGACDNISLADRMAYPVPTADLLHQTDEYDVQTGVGETVIHHLVNTNVGPGALAARRIPGLVLAPDGARGFSVAIAARLDNILADLQALALTAGLGFAIQQLTSGGPLTFTVYVPTDRSRTVRFSTRSGSLGGYTFSITAPTITTAIVGDGNTGVGRAFAEFTNAGAELDWNRRVEGFVDNRNTTDFTQITNSGNQALDAGAPASQVQFTPIDKPSLAYGIHYGLGDRVTVELATASVVDVVREVAIVDAGQGIKTSPVVGGPGATDPTTSPAIQGILRSIAIRLGLLERRS